MSVFTGRCLNNSLFLFVCSLASKNKIPYCSNNCRTSIFDFHRSCPTCSYDLCLTCCREIQYGHLQGGGEEVILKFTSRGLKYLHGGEIEEDPSEASNIDNVKPASEWKANADGSIPCPQEDRKGCGGGSLELRCMLSKNLVLELVMKAEELAHNCKLNDVTKTPTCKCSCFDGTDGSGWGNNSIRKASSRKDADDNYLFCPMAGTLQHEDLKHFQCHWGRGEPVIVSNVLETTPGLSWEPLVMWRACRQMNHTKHGRHLEVKAIDCLDWCEV